MGTVGDSEGKTSAMDATSADWKVQLHSRVECLKISSMHEGLKDLGQAAVGYEQKVYTVATSQKIDSKLDLVERRIQQTAPVNPSMPNTAIGNQNPAEPAIVDSSALVDLHEEIFQKKIDSKLDLVERRIQQTAPVNPSLPNTAIGNQNPAEPGLVDSSALVDLHEEIFQKITSMKEQYLPRLVHLSQRLTKFVQDMAAEESPAMVALCVNMKAYVSRVDHVISTLQISKEDIRPRLKERLPLYEEQISRFLDPPPRVNTDPPPELQQACKALQLLQRNHGAF